MIIPIYSGTKTARQTLQSVIGLIEIQFDVLRNDICFNLINDYYQEAYYHFYVSNNYTNKQLISEILSYVFAIKKSVQQACYIDVAQCILFLKSANIKRVFEKK